MRKVGVFYAYWTHEWEADFIPFVKKVKALGFDQLEVHGGAIAEMDAGSRKKLREEANQNSISLSYGIGLTPDHDVSSLDEATRNRGLQFMKRMIDAVAEMGGGMIGGTVHSCWPSTLPAGYENKQPFWDQSIRSMKELAPFAADRKVILNVEVINRFEQFLLNTCVEAVKYVEEIDNPACRILLDTFHMNIEEDSIGGAIRHAGRYLSALHVGETNRKLPGMGRMPWAEVKKALDDINFDGPIVMEPFVLPGGTIGRNIGIWREIVPNPDLDGMAAEAVRFVRKNLL
jgi:D-psicose/D-tagatose/L-ribulose 3-epimerase